MTQTDTDANACAEGEGSQRRQQAAAQNFIAAARHSKANQQGVSWCRDDAYDRIHAKQFVIPARRNGGGECTPPLEKSSTAPTSTRPLFSSRNKP
jgi:hypothetical protein